MLALIIATGCTDLIEKKLEIYTDAIEQLDEAEDLVSLMSQAIATESAVARAVAKTGEEKMAKMKEEYGTEYEAMLDSVDTVRDSYYRSVDKIFLGYAYNFLERRTLLYNMAADSYCIAECTEELDAVRELIKRYSKLSYVNGQRACDPPLKVREEYEAAKELAENCYSVAQARIKEEKAIEE